MLVYKRNFAVKNFLNRTAIELRIGDSLNIDISLEEILEVLVIEYYNSKKGETDKQISRYISYIELEDFLKRFPRVN